MPLKYPCVATAPNRQCMQAQHQDCLIQADNNPSSIRSSSIVAPFRGLFGKNKQLPALNHPHPKSSLSKETTGGRILQNHLPPLQPLVPSASAPAPTEGLATIRGPRLRDVQRTAIGTSLNTPLFKSPSQPGPVSHLKPARAGPGHYHSLHSSFRN